MKETTFTLIGLLIVFFTPIAPLMLIVAGFIVMDTILGVTKAIKLKQGFTSHKLSRLIFKMFFYQMVILLIFPIDVFLIGDDLFGYQFFATKVVTFVLIFVESLSIEENIKAINNNKGFRYYFEKLLKTIKNGKNKIIEAKKDLK